MLTTVSGTVGGQLRQVFFVPCLNRALLFTAQNFSHSKGA